MWLPNDLFFLCSAERSAAPIPLEKHGATVPHQKFNTGFATKNEMWYCGDLFFVSFVTVHGALKRFTKHFLHSAWLRGLLKQLLGGLIWETTAGNS